MGKNKIISIGFLGGQKCYLNISREDAVKRYAESEGSTIDEVLSGYTVKEFEFEDEFSAYDVGEEGDYL